MYSHAPKICPCSAQPLMQRTSSTWFEVGWSVALASVPDFCLIDTAAEIFICDVFVILVINTVIRVRICVDMDTCVGDAGSSQKSQQLLNTNASNNPNPSLDRFI